VTVGPQQATLQRPHGAITYRFHARDLHLVLAELDGKPVRFRVILDGATPGQAHGIDTNADGDGVVTGQRLYQLIRQNGPVRDRTVEIRFLDAGVLLPEPQWLVFALRLGELCSAAECRRDRARSGARSLKSATARSGPSPTSSRAALDSKESDPAPNESVSDPVEGWPHARRPSQCLATSKPSQSMGG